MAVKEIHRDGYLEIKPREFTCLAVDSTAWKEANKTILPQGSTLKELDGDKKKYQLHDSDWYEIA